MGFPGLLHKTIGGAQEQPAEAYRWENRLVRTGRSHRRADSRLSLGETIAAMTGVMCLVIFEFF